MSWSRKSRELVSKKVSKNLEFTKIISTLWQNINLKHSTMKKLYSTILMLVMLLLPIQMRAEGSAIKVEFGDTSKIEIFLETTKEIGKK